MDNNTTTTEAVDRLRKLVRLLPLPPEDIDPDNVDFSDPENLEAIQTILEAKIKTATLDFGSTIHIAFTCDPSERATFLDLARGDHAVVSVYLEALVILEALLGY
jgi:hypothetical protein